MLFLQAAAAHLDPAVDFEFSINGVPVATADIDTLAAAVGGQAERMGDYDEDRYLCQGPFSAYQSSVSDYVELIWLLDEMGRAEDVTIWPSEYFAGIAVTDTLDQALEKLGFTAEERAWLAASCSEIVLSPGGNGTWTLNVMLASEEAHPQQECYLGLQYDIGDILLVYTFEYVMEKAGMDAETPVDGRAMLKAMRVTIVH